MNFRTYYFIQKKPKKNILKKKLKINYYLIL